MGLKQAIEYALSEQEEHGSSAFVAVPDRRSPDGKPEERLTARQRQVALLVGRGMTSRRIAQELSISERTVENHTGKILKELGFSSRTQIAAWAAHR